ncbi:MAG: hypothetical protein U0165_00310 [Polyangiaceae bacterium]
MPADVPSRADDGDKHMASTMRPSSRQWSWFFALVLIACGGEVADNRGGSSGTAGNSGSAGSAGSAGSSGSAGTAGNPNDCTPKPPVGYCRGDADCGGGFCVMAGGTGATGAGAAIAGRSSDAVYSVVLRM